MEPDKENEEKHVFWLIVTKTPALVSAPVPVLALVLFVIQPSSIVRSP
jgi:hypothetical protein